MFTSQLDALVFALPPATEQQVIVELMDERLSVIGFSAAHTDVQLARVNLLRQSILKGAFTGKCVAQDPNDEPASALLERIRAERETPNGNATAKEGKRNTKRQTQISFVAGDCNQPSLNSKQPNAYHVINIRHHKNVARRPAEEHRHRQAPTSRLPTRMGLG